MLSYFVVAMVPVCLQYGVKFDLICVSSLYLQRYEASEVNNINS